MKEITILGSTGSIGVNTLDVISRHQDKFNVKALTSNTNLDVFIEQCLQYKPEYAVMVDKESASKLEEKLKKQSPDTSVLTGVDGLVKVAELNSVDYVIGCNSRCSRIITNISSS